jgi:aminoglycoside phosphotransferase (APT) family kinase protein
MHEGELSVSPALVEALLREQLPALSGEPIRRVVSSGTVNALFRIGDDALVRLPIMQEWSDPIGETETLSVVEPALTTRIPAVRYVGEPGAGYPGRWLVLDWIEGITPAPGTGGVELAGDLVRVMRELWTLPTAGAREGYRRTLVRHDTAVREALAAASDLVDEPVLTRLWDDALAAPLWDEPARWTHSDLLAGNVLLDESGRLVALLDWEAAGIGDPACDLMSAWSIVDAAGRRRMQKLLDLDTATWRRGRGWALAQAAIALPYYRDTNPGMVANSLHVLGELAREAQAPLDGR